MFNKVILIGRLTRDPEYRAIAGSGTPTTSFTLAVDRPFSNKQTGDREADFIPVVTWRRTAELCRDYLHKGSLISVEGRIQTRSYDGNDGQKRYVTEVVADNVVFLEPKSQSSNNGQYGSNQGGYNNGGYNNNYNNNSYNSNNFGGNQNNFNQGTGYGNQDFNQQANYGNQGSQQNDQDEDERYSNASYSSADFPF